MHHLFSRTVDTLAEKAVANPETVYEDLNQIAEENPEDPNYVEKAAEGVLDEIFADDAYAPETIEEMKDNNTSAIVEEKIEDYEEAKEERESADDLAYVPGEAVVAYEEGTSREDIDKLMFYMADSYEVLMEGHLEVPEDIIEEDISEQKKERLEKIKEMEFKPVVKMKLKLDQTVQKAIDEVDDYEDVIYAEENNTYELKLQL